MRIGRIEGLLIGQSRRVTEEWVVTTKVFKCDKCGCDIPALTKAYRQTFLEGRRFDYCYTYCQSCAEGVGKKPPQEATLRQIKTRRAKKERERQRPLFPDS
ncbi:MAG: hypothetical protein Q7S09_00100 [bacterium]|nr:hypothetical protein [bacterium]